MLQLSLVLTAAMPGDKKVFGLGLDSLCWSAEAFSQPWSSCKPCLLLFTLGLKLMLQGSAVSIWRKQHHKCIARDIPCISDLGILCTSLSLFFLKPLFVRFQNSPPTEILLLCQQHCQFLL